MQTLAALSIGSRLPSGNFDGVVSGSFSHTCNVTLTDGSILTCATADYFNMPRGMLIDSPSDFKFNQIIACNHSVYCRNNILRFSNFDLKIDLRHAKVWQPKFAIQTKPTEPLIETLWQNIDHSYKSLLRDWILHATDLPVTELIGRGPGLTPLGDDILTGAFSALSLLSKQPHFPITAYDLTTDISRQMIRDASNGQIIEPIFNLMSAFYNNQSIDKPLGKMLEVGSSSGEAMLIGVLAGIAHCENYHLPYSSIKKVA